MQWPLGFFDKPEKELLLDLVYMSTHCRVPADKITFKEPPQALDQRPDLDDDSNSFIGFKLKQGWNDELLGENGLMYRRVPLHEATRNQAVDNLTFPLTIYGILPQINAQLGMRLTQKDVYNATYLTQTTVITVRAKPGSLNYIGKAELGYLEDMIPVNYLSGFTEYVVPA